MGLKSVWTKVYQTLASVRTGIFFIIVVGIFATIGTVILQRPTSEPADLQRAYSPETLLWLDRLGLTDMYHVWWFLLLLTMICVCLIFVSVDRWPNAWKVYAKPVRFALPSFRASLPQAVKIAVTDEAAALSVAERILSRFGFKPERVTESDATGLFAQKQRFSVFAVFVVHLSLLCIFAGYIVDQRVGYRGDVMVPEGEALGQITLRDNRGGQSMKTLPFLIRCDQAGLETWPDGSPKKYWSKLALVEDGKDVVTKMIIVNDPLVYKGIHIYQSSMGRSNTPKALVFTATPIKGGEPATVEVPMGGNAALPDGESLSILRWVSDYYIQDNEVYNKSSELENPAVQLGLTNAKGETKKIWLFAQVNSTKGQEAPYEFEFAKGQMSWEQYFDNVPWGKFTGLEVAHHPGQYGVFTGVVLMAIGLVIAFYTQHSRIWAMIIEDGKGGKLLWVGGTTNKNRERFQAKFEQIKTALQEELSGPGAAGNNHKNEVKTLAKA
jgi:cytochrome c biogenesis protein